MDKHEYIDTVEGPAMGTTVTEIIDNSAEKNYGIDIEVDYVDNVTLKNPNQTISNMGIPTIVPDITEEKTINYNKPWRQVIRRRVIDGRDYNKSKDK